jgi:hypothetical protein
MEVWERRAYHLFVATDRRLGKGTLWRTIWSRE